MIGNNSLPNDIEIVEPVNGGYSGADLYKVQKDNNVYLMKIYDRIFNDNEVKRLEEVCKIYKENNINSLFIVGHGRLKNEDKYYFLYNYIDGIDFEVYSEEKLNLEETYKMGVEVGNTLRKLQDYVLPINTLIDSEDIDELTNSINVLYENIKKDKEKVELIEKYFKIENINKRVEKFNQCKDIFKSMDRVLIHGDIKRSNVMLDDELNTRIIDIRNMKNSYEIMNFRHQITWTLFKDNKKAKEFAKGYFDGIYGYTRPDNFNDQIDFIVTLNFIEETDKMNNKDELEEYYKKVKILFQDIEMAKGNIV